MGQSFAIDGVPGLLLLLLPVLALAIVVVWAVRQTRSKQPPSDRVTALQERSHVTAASPSPTTSPRVPELTTIPAVPKATSAAPTIAPPPANAQPVPEIAAPAAIAPPSETPEALAAAIAKLEAGGEDAELAGLYIRQATAYVEQGRKEEAASRLRDAIRVAALNGLAAPHALARVELGDLYLSNGDPITACEQWQIARNLFHDLARRVDRDDVDKRMLGNGCPTDWVLTDF
jgi:hypothetical protein